MHKGLFLVLMLIISDSSYNMVLNWRFDERFPNVNLIHLFDVVKCSVLLLNGVQNL